MTDCNCGHPQHLHVIPPAGGDARCTVEGCGCPAFAEDIVVVSGEVVDAGPVADGLPDQQLTTKPTQAVVPFSPAAGEVIDLADKPRVAATIRELTDWSQEVMRPLLDALQAAMVEEADRQGAYTLRYGKIEVKVDGPDVAKTEWQDDLRPMLAELVLAGLPEDRAAMLAREQVTWKVDTKECGRIAKNPVYAAIIDRYRTREPRKRTVTVKRST